MKHKLSHIEVGDIVEVTSTNFKTFFLDATGNERVIGLITRIDPGYDTTFADEWLYFVTLINGEIFSLYVNEFKVIAKANKET